MNMKLRHRLASLCLLPAFVLLTACTPTAEQLGQIDARMQKANERVQEKMAGKQETLASEDITLIANGLPDARISPRGELFIDEQPVPLTPEQQQLTVRYREQIQLIAADGMAIGMQGAELGLGAATSVITGLLGGKPESDIKAEVEAQAEGIRQAAKALCDRLPDLARTQQELASQIPAFAPYATEKQIDMDQCRQSVASSN